MGTWDSSSREAGIPRPCTTARAHGPDSLGPHPVLYVPPTQRRRWVLATCWASGSLSLPGSTLEMPGERVGQAEAKL